MPGSSHWKVLLSLVLTLLIGDIAEAGHAVWETSRVVNPEWVSLSRTSQALTLWPNKFMRYCFATDEAERKFHIYTIQAMDLWYAAGLPSNFKHEWVSLKYCDDHPETTLKIHYTPGTMATMLGLYREPTNPTFNRPVAYWDDDPNMGYSEIVSTIAHELGHSWGLAHEQQNRLYHWNAHGNPYRVMNFYCERLVDFAQKTQGLSEDQIWNWETGVCRDNAAASSIGWGAQQWLPFQGVGFTYYSPHTTFPTIYDVDWDSIMLYPSWFGTPKREEDGDLTTAVLLKAIDDPNQQYIWSNMAPSEGDIEGLKTLYHHRWPIPAPTLYNSADSPYNNAFRALAPGCYTS